LIIMYLILSYNSSHGSSYQKPAYLLCGSAVGSVRVA
jgi:hypothetical protein